MRGLRPDVPKTRQRSEKGGGWPEEVRVVVPAGCQHYAALGERTAIAISSSNPSFS